MDNHREIVAPTKMSSNRLPFVLITIIVIAIQSTALAQNRAQNPQFLEKVLDFAIEVRGGNLLQIPHLYTKLATTIPFDGDESLLMAEALKRRGFKVVHWGRGNYPPLGVRIVSLTLNKGDCNCRVDKIYYKTDFAFTYEMSERISCETVALKPK